MIQPKLVDATKWPYIAFIRSFFPTQRLGRFSVGSGTLIGPRVVLTAGHVVYDHFRGGFAKKIAVTLGGQPRITRVTTTYETTTQWRDIDSRLRLPDSAFDYGVIVLPEAIDSVVTPVPFETTSRHTLAGLSLNVAGYPIQPPNTLGSLYGARHVLSDFNDFRLYYPIATRDGMSGGPVYSFDEAIAARTVRGIHTSRTSGQGCAVRINENVHHLLQEWLGDYRPT